MRSKYQLWIIAGLLVLTALSIMLYKVKVLGIPLFGDEKRTLYTIESKISFEGTGKGAFISLALPPKQPGFFVENATAASKDFGFYIAEKDGMKRAEWSRREVTGPQNIYYTLEVIKDPHYRPKIPKPVHFDTARYKDFELEDLSAEMAKELIADARLHSKDAITFTAYLIAKFNEKDPGQTVRYILHRYAKNPRKLQDVFMVLLAKAGIDANRIGALRLDAERIQKRLIPMLEVYEGDKRQLFDLKKGPIDRPEDLFIWLRGQGNLLITEGVKKSRIKFDVTRKLLPARQAALTINKEASSLIDFSLFTLPVEAQNTFKRLLLVPIGALVVVLLRLFVGLKTSGTFMPVLLVMAFVQTKLLPGIAMFLLVVSIGLLVRAYLAKLNLLLVARISAVLIVVVGIMVYVAIFSYKLGLQQTITITFFPMIILAWTIERMSILWEEDGPKEVLIQGSGSLIVAIFAYFAMINKTLGYLTYNFPETLLIVLAIIILVGRYSGYRRSELYRFAAFAKRIEGQK
jgi:hypothetical protein